MNQQVPQFIHWIVDRLQSIQGIVAIALGGSRARGTHTQKSDVDLGIDYRLEKQWQLPIALRSVHKTINNGLNQHLLY